MLRLEKRIEFAYLELFRVRTKSVRCIDTLLVAPGTVLGFIQEIKKKPLVSSFSGEFFSCVIESIVMVIPGANDLGNVSKTRVTRIGLGLEVSGLEVQVGGRNKSGNILPRPNSPLLAEYFKRTLDISIYVIAQPNEDIRIKFHYCIPDGLL